MLDKSQRRFNQARSGKLSLGPQRCILELESRPSIQSVPATKWTLSCVDNGDGKVLDLPDAINRVNHRQPIVLDDA